MNAASLAGILPLLVAIVLLALAIFVYRTARDRAYNVAFAALYLLSSIKSLGEGLLPMAHRLHDAAEAFPEPIVWQNVSVVAALLIPSCLLLFVAQFPRPWPALVRTPRLAMSLFGPALIFAYLFYVPLDLPTDYVISAFNLYALTVSSIAVWLLSRARASLRDRVERTRAGYVLGALAAYLGATFVVAALQIVRSPLQFFFVQWITPVVEILTAAVVGYAIVKYQILGVELKVKVGAKYALTTATLLTVLFTVNNWVGEFILEPIFGFTQYYWILAAVVGGLLFKPVESGASWLVNKMFPATAQKQEKYLSKRGQDIYQSQLNYILRDGEISAKERRFLDNLRAQLELSAADARKVETGVRKALAAEGRMVAAVPRRRASAA